MRAVMYREYGGPEVLEYAEMPDPVPGRGEALVEVHAAGINGFDLMARSGRYKPNKNVFPHILGGDFAGRLVAFGPDTAAPIAIGARVTGWWVLSCGFCRQCRDGHPNRCATEYRYLGAHEHGAYAEYVKVPAANLIPLSDNLSFEEAAAAPSVFGTAWHMLVTRAQVKPAETVLVNAASSGLSTAAIQLCKRMGAFVIAASSTDAKLARAKEIGADEVINYNAVDTVKAVYALTNGRGVDVAVEHSGGDFLSKCLKCLTQGGRLVTVGGTLSYDCRVPLHYIFHKELKLIGSNSATKSELEAAFALLARGELRPVIDAIMPLEDAAEAHRRIEAAQHFGKIVLRVERARH